MPAMLMLHEEDPREVAIREVGDISDIEIFNNQVLVVIYERPEKTVSGLYITDKNRDEDKFQSKVGLIVKMGPDAFKDEDEKWFKDVEFNLADWVVYRPSDGWSISVNKKACRMLDDVHIRARVQHPDAVW